MKQTEGRFWRLLPRLTIANIVLLILLCLIERIVGERHWLATLITYAPQQIFGIPTALLLLWSIIARRRRMLGLNVFAAVFFVLTLLGFNIPLGAYRGSSGPRVRLMTYNMHHGALGISKIAANVRSLRADIVCFQEINPCKPYGDPLPKLKRLLPGWHSVCHGQLAIFSRFPIVEQSIHKPSVEFWRVFLRATVLVQGRRFTVIALHLNTAARPHSLADHPGSAERYLRGATSARSTQISELLAMADRLPGPIAIAGDFNLPPRGRLYHRITRRYEDSFHAVGWGTGYSYKVGRPMWRIDHIFVGKGARPVSCAIPALTGSDHRPAIAEIALTP